MAVELEFEKKPKIWLSFVDSLIMIKRSSTHIIRNMDQLLGAFFQPIMFLLLFAAVFGNAIAGLPEGVNYLSFLMAGIIVQTVAFGSTTTAIAVTNDMAKGIVDRFRSLPMSNLAVLNGHVISDVFRNAISTIVMLLTGLVLGFRTSNASVIDWLLIVGLLLLFTIAFSWLAAIVGVVAKSVEAVQWLSFIFIFPLTFASTTFVPLESMSSALRTFAGNQPITHIVEAVRSLMLGTPMGDHGWLAVIWSVGILIVSVPIAAILFRKRNA